MSQHEKTGSHHIDVPAEPILVVEGSMESLILDQSQNHFSFYHEDCLRKSLSSEDGGALRELTVENGEAKIIDIAIQSIEEAVHVHHDGTLRQENSKEPYSPAPDKSVEKNLRMNSKNNLQIHSTTEVAPKQVQQRREGEEDGQKNIKQYLDATTKGALQENAASHESVKMAVKGELLQKKECVEVSQNQFRTYEPNNVSHKVTAQLNAEEKGKAEQSVYGTGKDEGYIARLMKEMRDIRQNHQKGKEVAKKKGGVADKKQTRANLNRTMVSGPRRSMQSEEQQQVEERRMLQRIAVQKKKQNYQVIKEWDRKRAQQLALHARMVQSLQNEVDKRIKSSLQNFEIFCTFFREKARQEEKYCSSPVVNTRYALQSNSLSRNVYINCSVIMNSLSDQNILRCNKVRDFVHLIRNDILHDLMEAHLIRSQKELLVVREKISNLKLSLKKCNSQTEEETNELASFFGQSGRFAHQSGQSSGSHRDFYRTQLSFLRKASQQTFVQKTLGEYCLEYYHAAVQEQIKRSEVVREAMLTYSRGLKEAYDLSKQELQIEQLSKQEQIMLIKQFYALDEMFDARSTEIFKERRGLKGLENISIEHFTVYINQFHYEPFDCRIVLLKEFILKHISLVKGTKQGLKSTKETIKEQLCHLVITVDNFMHLFFESEKTDPHARPDITIRISPAEMDIRTPKGDYVDIVKKEDKRNSMMSYLWDNKVEKCYRLRFAKRDSQEEFMDYVKKLMALGT